MSLIINGEVVSDDVIREEMRVLRPHLQDAMAGTDPLEIEMRLREWSKENVIERVLLRQEARKQPLPSGCVTPPSDEQLMTQLMERIAAGVSPLRPKQALEYYKKHKDRFDAPEMVRVRHIVKNIDENQTEEAALEAIRNAQRELAGNDFAAVADRYSDCAGNGGDLGYFPRGEMVPEFEDVVFALGAGETSDIFRTPFGLHIARLEDRRPAGIRRFEEVRQDIENQLNAERRQEALERFLDGLRASAEVREVKQAQQ
jgi:parvulin-like peptidyl-prolyl isomerase